MSDNGQRVLLPGCMIGPSEPCDAFQRQTARIAELERERDRYHDALIARHGGEPVALLAELDEARARIVELEAELAAERERREAAEAVIHTCQWAMRQPLDGWKGECERKALDEARAHFARYEMD